MKTYVINLDKDTQRLYTIIQNAKRTNININRYAANSFPKEYSKDDFKNNEIANKYINPETKLRGAEIGCAISHISLWKQLSNEINDDTYYLILEDDIIIPENFNEKINDIMKELSDDWDFILLGGTCLSGKKINNINNFYNVVAGAGTSSYMISKRMSIKILNFMEHNKLLIPIDMYLLENFYLKPDKYKVYLSNHYIIKVSEDIKDSTTGNTPGYEHIKNCPDVKLIENL